jgi:hypothetical protein
MAYKREVSTELIVDNAVTNDKLSDMPANTMKGNNTGSPGSPSDLTISEVRDLLDVGQNIGTIVNPPALTGDVDDYAPTGLAPGVVLRIDPGTANRIVTGISAASFNDGDILYISNASTTRKLHLHTDDGSSLATNRFRFSGDITVRENMGITMYYDGVSQRFKTVSEYQ